MTPKSKQKQIAYVHLFLMLMSVCKERLDKNILTLKTLTTQAAIPSP